MADPFSRFHPSICFAFFIAAVVFGMFFIHPAFLAISLVCSVTYYLLLKGARGLRFLLGMVALIAVLTLINPLFNSLGDHVLFTYLGGRPYTLEGLMYGAAIAVMFATVLIWFACYNVIMTSDKFTYLFGRFIPSISLVLTMVLRLVPNYRRQAGTISAARMCVGKSPSEGNRENRVGSAATILSALTSWALENAIVTGDSMRSRGYGTGRRTNFAIYRMDARDRSLLAVMAAAAVVVVFCAAQGAMAVTYTPILHIAPPSAVSVCAMVAYAVLLAIPSAIHIWEGASWRISISRI